MAKQVFFAESEGKLYVKTKAIMHHMIPFIDGLPVVTFKRDKNLYLDVDVAIDWCKKEMQYHSKEKYEVKIAVMEKAKRELAERLAAEA